MTESSRIERDSLGEVRVPADALYGAQTQRAVENFPISNLRMPARFIHALGFIKAAAAHANHSLGRLPGPLSNAIQRAALQVARGKHDEHFPIDVFQTGSGTSSNMNANEVISRLASNRRHQVHPNDHVNMSQSSNDVVPSAIQVSAALALHDDLLPALQHLQAVLDRRAQEFARTVKTGRTHLMDAVPITLGQEFATWSSQIASSVQRLDATSPRLFALPLGGTAVGTGLNAPRRFRKLAIQELSRLTGLRFVPAANPFEGIATQDTAVELSGQLNVLAVALMKIANDLRWMNSGPLAGLGEIELPAIQPGSSIMPGKVNPVVAEAVAMACAQVMGNHTTMTVAGASGNFQLNVMLPVVAYNLLQSIDILASSSRCLADKALAKLRVREAQMRAAVDLNPMLVTALNPLIGYDKGAAIAQQAYRQGRPLLDVAQESTQLPRETLERLLDPLVLTQGGEPGRPKRRG